MSLGNSGGFASVGPVGMTARFFRLLRTVRHVPPGALWWRVRSRLMRLYFVSPLYGVGGITAEERTGDIDWVGVELLHGDALAGKAITAGKFCFAGVELPLGQPPIQWLHPKASALWIFNLHYHEWLADLRAAGAREAAQALVSDWLVSFGSYHPVAWHPYPTSLRLVAWLTHGKWLLEKADDDFAEAFRACLARQARYLAGNCELDLGGNHYLKNLKALIYCGLALEDGKALYEQGMVGFLRQLKVQFLADGMHYERSPLYQAQVLRDVLEVRAVLRKASGAQNRLLDEVCEKAGEALAFMCGADGTLALFNDSARLSADAVAPLVRLSGADQPGEILEEAGYARLARGKMLLLFDAGLVGPDENPGHAHADTLSFELCVGREYLFVNGGTYAYQDRLRNVFRSTALHSTVEVDGISSAEVWGGFRVGRRPRRVSLQVRGVKGGEAVVEGNHDGYRHIGIFCARKIVMAGDGSRLRGEDTLTVRRGMFGTPVRRRVMARFHVHPKVGVRLLSDREAELTLESGKKARFLTDDGRLDVKESQYAPQFGVMMPARQLVIHGRVGERDCRLGWQLIVE